MLSVKHSSNHGSKCLSRLLSTTTAMANYSQAIVYVLELSISTRIQIISFGMRAKRKCKFIDTNFHAFQQTTNTDISVIAIFSVIREAACGRQQIHGTIVSGGSGACRSQRPNWISVTMMMTMNETNRVEISAFDTDLASVLNPIDVDEIPNFFLTR